MKNVSYLDTFLKEVHGFLVKLSQNNSKEWFEEHRDEFEEKVKKPAEEFVVLMGAKLQDIVPDIKAIPKTDKSIFRLHRDTRFSKDKSPYKTNLGILFWEGTRKKMECPGFYFHIEPGSFMLGSGTYMFSKELLKIYRDAVADPVLGKELDTAVKKVLKKGDYTVGGKNYKKVPRGYDPESPYAEYLLHDGFYVGYHSDNPKALFDVDIIKFSYNMYKQMLPIHEWLVKITQ